MANTVDPLGGAWAIEEADQSHRGGGARAARADRRGRRHAGGHRAGHDPARDPGVGLPGAAGDRQRRARRRRRQPLRRRTSDHGASRSCSIDPEIERRQIGAGARRCARRATPAAWRAALDAVVRAARDGTNLVPPIIAAVEARATRRRDFRRAAARLRRAQGDRCLTASRPTRCQSSTSTTGLRPRTGRFVPAVIDVSFDVSAGRDAVPGRRIRQRQVGDGALDHAAGAAAGPDRRAGGILFNGRDLLDRSASARCSRSAARRSR